MGGHLIISHERPHWSSRLHTYLWLSPLCHHGERPQAPTETCARSAVAESTGREGGGGGGEKLWRHALHQCFQVIRPAPRHSSPCLIPLLHIRSFSCRRVAGGSSKAVTGEFLIGSRNTPYAVLAKAKELEKIRYNMWPCHIKDKQLVNILSAREELHITEGFRYQWRSQTLYELRQTEPAYNAVAWG